jgi:hypothetical protein
MSTIDELEDVAGLQLDSAGYPDCEFEELDESGEEIGREIDLLMRCVHAARQHGA